MGKIIEERCLKAPIFVVGTAKNQFHSVECCNNSRVANSITDGTNAKTAYFNGDSMSIEVWKGMPGVGSAKKPRSEIVVIKGSEDARWTNDSWYAQSLFFPSDGTQNDGGNRTCINQFYQTGGAELSIRQQEGKVFLEQEAQNVRFDLFGSGGSQSISAMKDIVRDKWVHFIFHIIHSEKSDGLIEVWRQYNGAAPVKIHTVSGITMTGSVKPKWKVGIYKSNMESSKYPSVKMKYDNVFYGDKTATLADMMIGEVVTPPAVNLPPIVNAGVDATIKLPTNSIILKDISSDPDGNIVETVWSKTSGPSATLTGNIVTNMVEGVYTFKVVAKDDKGAITSDTVNVTVLKADVVTPPTPVVDKFSVQTIVKKNGTEIKNTTIDF